MNNSFKDEDDEEYYDKKTRYNGNDEDDDYYDFDGDEEDEDEEDEEGSYKEKAVFFCNDCNYRWQNHISKKNKNDDYDGDYYNPDNCCPMCGSTTIDRV